MASIGLIKTKCLIEQLSTIYKWYRLIWQYRKQFLSLQEIDFGVFNIIFVFVFLNEDIQQIPKIKRQILRLQIKANLVFEFSFKVSLKVINILNNCVGESLLCFYYQK